MGMLLVLLCVGVWLQGVVRAVQRLVVALIETDGRTQRASCGTSGRRIGALQHVLVLLLQEQLLLLQKQLLLLLLHFNDAFLFLHNALQAFCLRTLALRPFLFLLFAFQSFSFTSLCFLR